jgi:hypothetical protein
VLVRCYHGLGDTLHFIRYLRPLAERARSVTVEAQPELLDLLTGMPGIARLFPLHPARDRAAAEFGCEIEIDVTELPYAFRATLEAIPAALPLHLDPARLEAARRRVAAVPARRKIGLVWAAGAWKPERSITVERLGPLGAVPGTGLVVLQRGPEHARWRRGRYGPRFSADLGSDDIADAAATIAGLDLVVTVDTMVAHLAGTLGVPVWVMLHFAADWRWLLGRDDSPWYPSMRLFRQPAAGDWDSVVAQIAAALAGADSEAATPPLLAAAAGPAAGVAAPLRR